MEPSSLTDKLAQAKLTLSQVQMIAINREALSLEHSTIFSSRFSSVLMPATV